ncbi:peptidoglycan-binding protein [Streptomyces sp. NPDC042638]|uniref:peptidoglycan-binding domain-containing protein n=1 Tax=Streptomyces sp. NPDC042638 TaxID=3154333 RepID=UPI0034053008
MTGSQGAVCPECGAPRGPDGSPSCDCTERASEALRAARTAEAAAAEDFDALRIRPYVEFPDTPAPPASPRPGAEGEGEGDGSGQRTDETVETVDAAGPVPDGPGEDGGPRRRSRRTVLLATGGAGVAIVAAAGFALFSYHAPARDRAAAQEVRESIPDATTRAPAPVTAPEPPVAPRSPAPSPSVSADPSPSATTVSPSPSPSATASGSASPTASAGPSTTVSGTPRTTPAVAPVLRRGDTGPEVTELQLRLRQLNLYADPVDGTFTRPVEDAVRTYQLARGILSDPLGEYGPATRKALESETTTP